MKKKLLSLLLVFAFIIPTVGAKDARWSYISAVIRGIEMTADGINWFASVDTYDTPSVTHTKVVAKLQGQAGTGWGTFETQTDKQPGTMAGVGGVYADWLPNKSYRVEVYGYAYKDDKIVETVGPLYAYLNT